MYFRWNSCQLLGHIVTILSYLETKAKESSKIDEQAIITQKHLSIIRERYYRMIWQKWGTFSKKSLHQLKIHMHCIVYKHISYNVRDWCFQILLISYRCFRRQLLFVCIGITSSQLVHEPMTTKSYAPNNTDGYTMYLITKSWWPLFFFQLGRNVCYF